MHQNSNTTNEAQQESSIEYNYHVIEDFYSSYQYPKVGKLQRFNQWKKETGVQVGYALNKLTQVASKFVKVAYKAGKASKDITINLVPQVFSQKGLFLIFTAISLIVILPQLIHDITWGFSLLGYLKTFIIANLPSTIDLMITFCYISGIAFSIKSALLLKEHNEGSQNTSIFKPMVFTIISALLIALPSLVTVQTGCLWSLNQGVL